MNSPLVAALILALAGSASAELCPIPEGAAPALAAMTTEARLATIGDGLARAAGPASTWNWGWGLGYATVGAAQLATAPLFDDRGRRIDFYVGGAKSLVAALSVAVLPLSTPSLDGQLGALRATRPVDCALLADAERLLAQAAVAEQRGKGWVKHVVGIAFNVGVSLILGLGDDRWGSAGLSFGTGLVTGEVMILTQPTASVRAWKRYLAVEGSGAPEISWAIVPSLDGRGLSVHAAWQF